MKKTITIVLLLVIILLGVSFFFDKKEKTEKTEEVKNEKNEVKEEKGDFLTYETNDYKIKYPFDFEIRKGDNPNFHTGSFLMEKRNSNPIEEMSVDRILILRKDNYSGTNLRDA